MKADKGLKVNGFLFQTESEAELAEKEIEGIQYLKSRIDLKRPDVVLKLYCKVLEQEFFKTVVGISFLKEMQEYLEEQPSIVKEEIPPIPIYLNDRMQEKAVVNKQSLNEKEATKTNEVNYKVKFRYSIIMNVLLALLIVFMFIIINTSGNINILNYENRLVDKYENWEQELKQREEAIQEREKK